MGEYVFHQIILVNKGKYTIIMRKLSLWLLMVPICMLAFYFMWYSMNYKIEAYATNASFIFLYFIFFILCASNMGVHLFAGFLVLFVNENRLLLSNFFYKKDNGLIIKILKIISYILILIYFISILLNIGIKDYYGVIWDLLAIIVTVFYIIWFQAVDKKLIKNNEEWID